MSVIKRIVQRSTFGQNIASALIEKYGAGVTIHFADATSIVFSCSSISDKVIKIIKEYTEYVAANEWMDRLSAWVGDTWTSGVIITNPYQFSGNSRVTNSVDASALIVNEDIILGDKFMLLWFNTARPQMMFVGKLTNSNFVVGGFVAESGVYGGNAHFYITSDTLKSELKMETMANPFNNDSKYIAMPIIFTKAGRVLKNIDGSFATIMELLNVCDNIYTSNDSIWISKPSWYTATYVQQLQTSLMVIL